MSPAATYTPGGWIALVSSTGAVLIDPQVPGDRLAELWRLIENGEGADAALAAISSAGPGTVPQFALAVSESDAVRLVVFGDVQVAVRQPDGTDRTVQNAGSDAWHEDWATLADTLWFLRPGGQPDGVALPIAGGAVMADVLTWQAPVGEPPVAVGGAVQAPVEYQAAPQVGGSVPPAETAAVAVSAVGSDWRAKRAAYVRSAGQSEPVREVVDPAAGRRLAGLTSHPRRRYGAADWSLSPHESVPDEPTHGVGIDTAVPELRGTLTEVRRPAAPAGSPAAAAPEVSAQEPVRPAARGVSGKASRTAARPTTRRGRTEPMVEPREKSRGERAAAPVAPPPAAVTPPPVVPPPAAVAPPPVVPPPVAQDPVTPPVAHVPDQPVGRQRAILVFADGEEVEVDGPLILGRAPSQSDPNRPARLVPVRGTGRGVSRNHLRVDETPEGLAVVDLGSSNGSWLIVPGAAPTMMEAGEAYALVSGTVITFADQVCEFRFE